MQLVVSLHNWYCNNSCKTIENIWISPETIDNDEKEINFSTVNSFVLNQCDV